jgi:hypothetical protein
MRRAIRLLIELLVCTIVGRGLAELLRYLADDLGVGWATTIVRPFGLVGFVFGNIHQGDRQLSAMTLTVALALVLFLVWRLALRFRQRRIVPPATGDRLA